MMQTQSPQSLALPKSCTEHVPTRQIQQLDLGCCGGENVDIAVSDFLLLDSIFIHFAFLHLVICLRPCWATMSLIMDLSALFRQRGPAGLAERSRSAMGNDCSKKCAPVNPNPAPSK